MTIAGLLDSLRSRIEALSPDSVANNDDGFRVNIGLETELRGQRAISLEATAPIRKFAGSLTCTDWQTTVTVRSVYRDTPAEGDDAGAYERCLLDAETILADLYTWATTTSGILTIDPQEAQPASDGQGAIILDRTINLTYERS